MSWTFYKLLLALFITLLISGACSKDSDEEFSGGSTTSSASFIINSTIPEDNATNVSVSSSIVIGFNNEVNSTSVDSNNFSLSTNGTVVSATLSHTKTIVVILPASSLSNGTPYAVSVSSTVKDTSGNNLSQDNTWKFTTVSASSDNSSGDTGSGGDTAADTTQPSVVSISPNENAG
ncbi:MAG: Ig-like domain-containing protein, partial [SAR324 cluster bacterium]|nr:Ig-like domain-containing protein [SAR324 cluster bacterium]